MKRITPLTYEVSDLYNVAPFATRICDAIKAHWPTYRPEFQIVKATPYEVAAISCTDKQPLTAAQQAEVNGFIQGYVFCTEAVMRQLGR